MRTARHFARLAILALPLLAACEDQAPVPVAAVDITPAPATVVAGQKIQLTATVKDAKGGALADRVVTWSTNNPTVATVSATGQVSGLSAGNAVISASAEAIIGSVIVSVTPAPLVTFNLSPNPVRLFVGNTQQLGIGMIDATGAVVTRPVTFASNNNAVATVSSTGLVTALNPGTATITGTADGRTATTQVVVSLVPIASITLTPANVSLLVGGQQQFTAVLRDSAGSIITGRVVGWLSSATGIASVNANGLVTALNPGTATITASTGDAFAFARVTVTAPPVTVGSVEVVPANAVLNVGSVQVFSAIVRDQNGAVLTDRTVTWASGNTAIVTVNASGVVTGVGAGQTTVTATVDGRVGTSNVNVGTLTPTITLVSVNSGGADVLPGASVAGTMTVTWRVTLPIGFSGRFETVFGGITACVSTLSAGGTMQVVCPINTAAVDENGVRVYPNGSTALSARILDASGAVLTTLAPGSYMVTN